MRLLTVGNMYPPHHLGGYEAVWHSTVEQLRGEGHDVRVLTSDVRVRRDAPPDPPHVQRALRWYWVDHQFPPRSLAGTLRLERHNARVLDAALAEQPDVVLWWAMGGMSLSLLARAGASGIPAGAVVHDAWPVYGPKVDGWLRRAARAPLQSALPARLAGLPLHADYSSISRWSFNSAFLRDGVRAAHREIAPAACSVDPPGVDAARFARVKAARRWRWRLACVGRIDERKGLGDAIAALQQLPREATLVIAGGGDERHTHELRRLADRLGVAARVSLIGQTDDVAGVFSKADVVLFPVTWDEPFGLVPLEAMAAGRPVVATATGGAAEYLRDAENALVVAARDPHAIASAVHRLARDPALRAGLIEGGRATAKRYTPQAFHTAIGALAISLAGARAGRAGR